MQKGRHSRKEQRFQTENDQCLPLNEDTVASIIADIEQKFPKVQNKHFSREEIAKKANLNVPSEFKNKYIDILYKQQFQ
jgi:hypothetical protein